MFYFENVKLHVRRPFRRTHSDVFLLEMREGTGAQGGELAEDPS